MKFNKKSAEYEKYLKDVKIKKIRILIIQVVLLIGFSHYGKY